MTAFLQSRLLPSTLLSLCALLGPCSAQLKVYAERGLKVEPGEGRDPSSFVVIVCNVEPVNATVPTRWVLPHGEIISESIGRYRIGQGVNGNGVWSTILAVQNVSYQDAGHYTCEVVPSSISRSQCECVDFPFSATTKLQLQVSLDALEEVVVATEGSTKSVQLGCEMKGFLRPDEDLNWFKDGNLLPPLERSGYSFAVKEGILGKGQMGENRTVHSRFFVLNINDPTAANDGVYCCKIWGTEIEANMSLTVSKSPVPGPITDMPGPSSSKGQGTDVNIISVSEKPSRGSFDGKNGKDLSGGSNRNVSGLDPSSSLGGAEVATIVCTACVVAAVISSLLTLTVTCFCLRRRQQSKKSENRSELVPSSSTDNRREVDSTYSIITSANIGASEGESAMSISLETHT